MMPHVTLEYSNDLVRPLDTQLALKRIHDSLNGLGMFKPENIKSRAVAHEHFRVGIGEPNASFVHLTVGIFDGRPVEEKQRIGKTLLDTLTELFADSCADHQCDFTVEIREIERASYSKSVSHRKQGRT
jgi:5-carboxymethyl-2-hydroxymuconate isomerase